MTTLDIQKLTSDFPLLNQMIALEEVSWFNPNITSLEEALPYVGLGGSNIEDASQRLNSFLANTVSPLVQRAT